MSKCKTPDDCRITKSTSMSTVLYYPPVYDGHGNNLNPDLNTTLWVETCGTCKKRWQVTQCNGETTREER